MDEKLQALMLSVDVLVIDIMEPLRRKMINESAFARLYTVLEEVEIVIRQEQQIDRQLAAQLFLVYSQLVTQSNYVYDKSPFVPHIGKLQGMIRKIFSGALQNV
ncbi:MULTISPECIES: hypothetical protein [unclassified Paenibacillus]|uniref:hypothetical protein n=1 Tax=unclassified Paenibacillus TaxID=185978 RepID=UPI002404BFB3|nr:MULTISPECIES: hypothetical protein [unclassified Paenibacillus]MDF9840409.1 hypothetical protein [Paenibacillus sp. PastF-2]MDF9846991.1 hypothetical protein [Paenibacillus sp. PastM-2]MDF9853563.1 hypothetical protein [Paenibacillus sp. PastF-1]MDH6478951.1 hypothetical protein [Paenibacillus sp. PastH-2]MDH6506683.1 hypothetical protein [Paenibacillus sp. PastM-3]